MTDHRTARADRAEEEAQAAYDAAYTRIETWLIAQNFVEGGASDYKPDGAMVHRMVLAEFKRTKEQ